MEGSIIDLRFKPEGCTDHPIIRLKRILSEFRVSDKDKLIIRAYLDDLPPKVLELITAKYGLKVEGVEQESNEVKAVIVRK